MTAIMVDSNVLLDLGSHDPTWSKWAAEAIERAANRARLVINPIVYAEVSVRYSRIEDLEDALSAMLFEREQIPYEAAFLAGKVFLEYRRRGGPRGSLLPDFLIGAHAAVAGYDLLTRDVGRYQTYYPRLTLITPQPRYLS